MQAARAPKEVLAPMAAFRAALRAQGYRGDLAADPGTRAVFSTDNSIYELSPHAVLFPKEPDDLNRILRAAQAARMPIAARGGGTGTNGQSLSDQIVVDCSRYLTQIEALDPVSRTATVQPGVILDQLNRAAAAHGLMFGPTVSTAAQATLGGMAATDASGKGSRVFGRTSDHILSMDVVLADGSDWTARALGPEALEAVCAQADLAGEIHRRLRAICARERVEIARVFPIMNRGLTGYNLKDLMTPEGVFSLTRLLAGSEGTLALTKRMTLQLLPKKQFKAMLVVAYDDALEALGDAPRLIAAEPTAVEFIDDKIVGLARGDAVWGDIAPALEQVVGVDARQVRGVNFVEVQGDTAEEIAAACTRLDALAGQAPASVISARRVTDAHMIAQLWALRAKCVGLLGRMDPARQGTPFVEDAAVPPQNLRAFVAGFRAILDAQGLAYGMFGHADVGCIHVRPALDLRRPQDAAMIRVVSDAVEALARAQGGVLWGEHGKGFRGEYVPAVFGPRLYGALCEIKACFDPNNLLNPGKIAAPDPAQALRAIDAVPMRGPMDARIAPERLAGFELSVKCNGNGQCFNRDPSDAMCPSYKATGDRRLSPKGRAAMLRAWLRAEQGGDAALEAELYASMSQCLACKACASRCPVKVDIPSLRAQFFAQYFRRNRRPLRHHLFAALEGLGPMLRRGPWLANAALGLGGPFMRALGLVDLPKLRPAGPELPAVVGARLITLVEDSFTASFDGAVIEACEELLRALGYSVRRSGPIENGKALAVLGFEGRFKRAAQRRYRALARLEGDVLLELEPAVSAMAQSEFAALGHHCDRLQTLDQFLARELAAGAFKPRSVAQAEHVQLFAHCTERAADPGVTARWQAIFAGFGIALTTPETGCCGMAGVFGHEAENQEISRRLFEMTWRAPMARDGAINLATGFSCRCQSKRITGERPRHPVEYLAQQTAQGC